MLASLIAAAAVVGCSGTGASALTTAAPKPTQPYEIVQAVAANESVIVAATQAGKVLKSSDQGKSWQPHAIGGSSIIGLATCPDGSFVGIDFQRKLWSANAQGDGWKDVALAKPQVPLAVTCDARGRWWAVGSGAAIAMSADRGATWSVTEIGDDVQFTTVQFVDDAHGFVLGEFGHVLATDDGGATWKKLPKIASDFYPYAALFRDRNEGWAAGIAGATLYTRDGGKSWSKTDNRSGAALYRLFMHGGQPYATGAAGVIAAFEQGAWQAKPYADAAPIFLGAGASLGDKHKAVIIGGAGGLLRVVSTAARQGAGS